MGCTGIADCSLSSLVEVNRHFRRTYNLLHPDDGGSKCSNLRTCRRENLKFHYVGIVLLINFHVPCHKVRCHITL